MELTPDLAGMTCEWFAYCQNQATMVVRHPIIGDVPICRRCFELQARQ